MTKLKKKPPCRCSQGCEPLHQGTMRLQGQACQQGCACAGHEEVEGVGQLNICRFTVSRSFTTFRLCSTVLVGGLTRPILYTAESRRKCMLLTQSLTVCLHFCRLLCHSHLFRSMVMLSFNARVLLIRWCESGDPDAQIKQLIAALNAYLQSSNAISVPCAFNGDFWQVPSLES